jgi:site-specific DNA-methyltransferase (adenine-specific)
MNEMKIEQDITLIQGDNTELMKKIESESVDCILTDPPYKYLKNQKLEVDFDENMFFNECKRILKKDGFIVLFGRGTSFYRWNCMLADSGFVFKEEIIWNKNYGSSPLMAITRVHESISIHSKGKSAINKVKVPYKEMKGTNLADIHRDIKRIKTVLSNKTAFDNLKKYLIDGSLSFDGNYEKSTTITSGRKRVDRVVSTAQMILEGMNEKSIITIIRDHYSSIHPTQKPVRLLERLLAIVTKEGDLVLDPFAGSASTGCACINTNRKFIGFEIDLEYYEAAKKRIIDHQQQTKLF